VHNASWSEHMISSTSPGLPYAQNVWGRRRRFGTGISGSANLGYLRFIDRRKSGNPVYILGRAGATSRAPTFPPQGPEIGVNPPSSHTEQRLFASLRRMSRVPECNFVVELIFSERTPCSSCGPFLTMEITPYNQGQGPSDVPLYYVVMFGPGSDAALIRRYRNDGYF
jgi:hypothetical protein